MGAEISQLLKSVSPLQLGLIIAGVVLVVGVLIYNWWLERRVRRRITATFRQPDSVPVRPSGPPSLQRVEPTLRAVEPGIPQQIPADAVPRFRPPAVDDAAPGWQPPMDVVAQGPASEGSVNEVAAATPMAQSTDGDAGGHRKPDPEIECIVTLQPAKPVGVGALAAGLHARLGKRLRWFGRIAPDAPWQILASDTRGEFVEVAACLLLADRNGAASRAQLDMFVRVLSELAPLLPAAMSVPDAGAETERAETLDRLCADVDVQIGLTILKGDAAGISPERDCAASSKRPVSSSPPAANSNRCRRIPARSSTRCRTYARAVHGRHAAPVRDQRRRDAARRAARGRPAARVRSDALAGQAVGPYAWRGPGRRQPAAADDAALAAIRTQVRRGGRRCARSASSRGARGRWPVRRVMARHPAASCRPRPPGAPPR